MDSKTYQIEGLSCPNCSAKFEKNVNALPSVSSAKVNFNVGKITVEGNASIEELEQAGAFDKLKLIDESNFSTKNTNLKEKAKENWTLILSSLLILSGLFTQTQLGEKAYLTIFLYILAIIIGGFSLFKEGLSDLLKLNFSMSVLMTVAIIGASIIGQWTEGAIVVILFAFSEALERFSMDKARQSIRSLMAISPKEALIIRNGITVSVPVENIQLNDILLVKPGQKIAMDGVVTNGYSSVNQAAITGESVPVRKEIADDVFAGTLNEDGVLEIRVTKLVKDSTISKIIHLVEEAQDEKAPAQTFIDQFTKYYTPSIMLISLLVILIPPLFFDGQWHKWLYQGLSLLVVGCPCSLVISTPVSIVSAISNAAKNGVLIKGGIYLEEMAKLQAIAFDKTGTLTKGKPVVTDFLVEDISKEDDYMRLIAALESYSQHPLASAIMTELADRKLTINHLNIEQFSSITGKGVQATIDGEPYLIGNTKLFEQSLKNNLVFQKAFEKLQKEGKTVMIFGNHHEVLALIAVSDEIRFSSESVIRQLHQIGVSHTIMLTGDNKNTALAIGKQIGVSDVKANLMPQDKLDFIKSFKENQQKIAMVGDGINDAPALAYANIGIAMGGSGTDTALETADIALMGDNLEKLPFLIKLSRRTLRIIKQNITISLIFKLVALLLIIPGWLTLWLAIIADVGATIIVTLNGLRLMRIK